MQNLYGKGCILAAMNKIIAILGAVSEEITEIKMHIKKIMRLSIFEILVGCFIGT